MSDAVRGKDDRAQAGEPRPPAPSDAAARFVRAEALSAQGAAPEAIVKELVLFVRGAPDVATANQAGFVLRHAHMAFRERLRDEAAILYDWLVRSGHGNATCDVRRALWRQQNNDPQAALQILQGLEADGPLDTEAALIKARALLALERHDEAVAPLKFVLAAKPGRIEVVRLLFTALEQAQAGSELCDAEKFLVGLPRENHFEFLLRARLAREDYAGAAKLCSENPASVTGPGLQRIGQVMQALAGNRDFDAVDLLFDAAGGVRSKSPVVIGAKLHALLARKELEAAERILNDAEPLLQGESAWDLRLRKLKYFCLSMQLDRAVEYLGECTAAATLPAGWTATVAGLYSARGEWEKILDLARDRVQLGYDIANAPVLEALGRAARHTGRYDEALQLLDDLLAQAPNALLANFRDRLVCEIALIAESGGRSAAPSSASLAIANPLYAERARWLSLSRSAPIADERERTIFFCADASFVAGTSVALFSLLRNNVALCRKCSLYVVCADAALDFAAEVFRRIGAAFAVSIETAPAGALLGGIGDFKREWGFFTVRQGLADAAYYRIFAAQHLLARGTGGRALYIDSDTLVGRGAADIFRFDLEGQPLGARRRIAVREIAQAAAALGVDPEKYFNSGVLLFDLDHPGLAAALARSVEIARDEKALLTFHDQCALNLAFRDCSTALPESFNWLLRASAPEEPTGEPVILHFTASPKPWDPMYPTTHCMRWIREFAMLSELLTPEMSRRLLLSQFADPVSARSSQPNV